jgi:hypothetical protein
MSTNPNMMPEPAGDTVVVIDDRIIIRALTVVGAEAAALVRSTLDDGGPEAVTDLIRRALPVGLVAMSMTTGATETAIMASTLDAFRDRVDASSRTALVGLDQTLASLRAGEATITAAAQNVLAQLPAQIDAVLGGEAGNVRLAVAEATRAVQATGMTEIRSALALHAEMVRNAVSLDRDSPVQALQREVLAHLDSSRQELSEQLTVVRGLLQVDEAQKAASAHSSRAVGADWEAAANVIAHAVVTAAGDRYAATGSTSGPLGSARSGDGVATLSSAITGHGKEVRVVIEAKRRSRVMSAQAFKKELATSRSVRQAEGALALVPTMREVPGGGRWCRVDDLSWVVAADDQEAVSLIYLILRELVSLVAVQHAGGTEVDLGKAQAQIKMALSALAEFDEIARLTTDAQKTLTRLFEVGRNVKTKVHEALMGSLSTLQA